MASAEQFSLFAGCQIFDPERISTTAFEYYPPLRRLQGFVDEHYSEPLPLSRAASVAGFEATYFSRFFREKTGVCYRDWLTWIRVVRAMELMQAEDRSVTEIGLSVGFQSLRSFERACGRMTGLPPAVLKERLKPC